MRLTKKERLQINNRQFCDQYIKLDWDGCAANDYFANRYDGHVAEKYSIKPRTSLHIAIKETEIAINQLNGAIAPIAFEKKTLVSFLTLLNENNVLVSDNIQNGEKYIEVYLSTAKEILDNISKNAYRFQNPLGHG